MIFQIPPLDENLITEPQIIDENFRQNFLFGDCNIDFSKMSVSSGLSSGDILMLLIAFYVRFKCSGAQMNEILKIINLMFQGDVVPNSFYMFEKLISSAFAIISFNFFCKNCKSYLKKSDYFNAHTNEEIVCDCHEITIVNLKYNSYFVTFNIENQLKQQIVNHNLIDNIIRIKQNHRNGCLNNISDITDSSVYHDAVTGCDDFLATFNFNIDAAQLFRSSKSKITPVQIYLNELPIHLRNNNIINCGIWLGDSDPPMELFLKPFSEMFSNLDQFGIKVPYNNDLVTIKIRSICGTFDSKARPLLLNMKQYNGYNSCTWCLHPGVRVERIIKYPCVDFVVEKRTDECFIENMLEAHSTQTVVNGVKGPPPILNFCENFPIISSMSVDYLHAVCIGQAKHLTECLLSNFGKQYYIGNPSNINVINKMLNTINYPREIRKKPDCVQNMKLWKASHWYYWIVFASKPCLKIVLSEPYYSHWCKFVAGIQLLQQDKISLDECEDANNLLNEFSDVVQEHYGLVHMTFNNHILKHLGDNVLRLGPLWSNSTFPFESELYFLKQLVHNGVGALIQLAKQLSIRANLSDIAGILIKSPIVHSYVSELCHKVLTIPDSLPFHFNVINSTFDENELEIIKNYGLDFSNLILYNSVTIFGKYIQTYKNCNLRNSLIFFKGEHILIYKIFSIGNAVDSLNIKFLAKSCNSSNYEYDNVNTKNHYLIKINNIEKTPSIKSCNEIHEIVKCVSYFNSDKSELNVINVPTKTDIN